MGSGKQTHNVSTPLSVNAKAQPNGRQGVAQSHTTPIQRHKLALLSSLAARATVLARAPGLSARAAKAKTVSPRRRQPQRCPLGHHSTASAPPRRDCGTAQNPPRIGNAACFELLADSFKSQGHIMSSKHIKKCDRPMTAVVPLHTNPRNSVCCARGTRVILSGL